MISLVVHLCFAKLGAQTYVLAWFLVLDFSVLAVLFFLLVIPSDDEFIVLKKIIQLNEQTRNNRSRIHVEKMVHFGAFCIFYGGRCV